ncbi:MAG: hemerythrin domain-containing protein [Chloroflexi bacterium]|nr:hemerythrin domain-containing protein [Chloroflexota bacterium]
MVQEQVLAIINRVIEEHKVIHERMSTLQSVANDAEAMLAIEKAKESFVPGRLDQAASLVKFREISDKVDTGLRAHFNFEETSLLTAFQNYADTRLAAGLQTLLLEHKDLTDRMNDARRHLADLTGGQLSRHAWEATAHDLRAHITHTRKLIEGHNGREQVLLVELQKQIKSAGEGTGPA